MKKLITIILMCASLNAVSQTTQKRIGLSPNDGSSGYVYTDTVYTVPFIAGLYFNGYGNFYVLADTVKAIMASSVTLSTLTDSSVVLWNYSTRGTEAKVTLAGNRTLSITNLPTGIVVYLTLSVIQDGTGTRTLALPSGTKVINGGTGAVTLSTTAASTDILSFRWTGYILFCTYGKNYN